MVEKNSNKAVPHEEGKKNFSLSFFSYVLVKMFTQLGENQEAKGNGKSMDDHYKAVLSSKTATAEQKARARILMEGSTIKEQAIKMMDYLGLPRYNSFKTTVAKALNLSVEEIKKHVNPPTGRYYTNITKLTGGRVFELDQEVDRVVPYIKEMHDSGEVEEEDKPMISDFYRNTHSLNIIIGEDGHILVEMIHGKHSGLAYGKRSPEMIVRKSVQNNFFSKFDWENRGIILNNEEFVALTFGQLPEKLKNSFESIEDFYDVLVPEFGKISLSKSENKKMVKNQVPKKMKKYFRNFEDFCEAFDWKIETEMLGKSEIEQLKTGELPANLEHIFPSVKAFLEYAIARNTELDLSKSEVKQLIKGELTEPRATEIYESLSWEKRTIDFSEEDLNCILKGELSEKWSKIFGSLDNFYKAFDSAASFSINFLLTDEELAKWQQLVFRILRKIPKDTFRSKPDLGNKEYNETYAERIHAPGYYEVIVSESEIPDDNDELVTRTIIKFLDYRKVDNYGFKRKSD